MNPHLIRIPGLAPFTTGRLPRRDLQALCRQADRALDAQVLGFGTLDQLLADFLERLDFAGGQGNPDLMDFLVVPETCQLPGRKCVIEVGKWVSPTGPSP